MKNWLKANWSLIVLWLIFESVAVVLSLVRHNKFFLFNFSYIGSWLAIGVYLYSHHVKYARNVVQFAIGAYILVYLGIIRQENMLIEGFWYYLFNGVFGAAVIHYLVAKIFGPLFFGRGWCGYACWTPMLLDLLPYKVPQSSRKKLGFIRYLTFAASLLFVIGLILSKIDNIKTIIWIAFLAVNLIYYTVGAILALVLRDNRAFCKYVCPVTVILKPMSYFSILRVKCDKAKCVGCQKCLKVCPMDVDMLDSARSRKNGTECIMCHNCINECPKKALHM